MISVYDQLQGCQACAIERYTQVPADPMFHQMAEMNGCMAEMVPERFQTIDLDYLLMRGALARTIVFTPQKVMERYYEMINLDNIPVRPDRPGITPLVTILL